MPLAPGVRRRARVLHKSIGWALDVDTVACVPHEDFPDWQGFATPEAAALSSYSLTADAHVLSVTPQSSREVTVTVHAGPRDSGYSEYHVDCAKHDDGLWYDEGGRG